MKLCHLPDDSTWEVASCDSDTSADLVREQDIHKYRKMCMVEKVEKKKFPTRNGLR